MCQVSGGPGVCGDGVMGDGLGAVCVPGEYMGGGLFLPWILSVLASISESDTKFRRSHSTIYLNAGPGDGDRFCQVHWMHSPEPGFSAETKR